MKLAFCMYWWCCSVTQSCPTLRDPTDCSMPGFLVLHHLPEFAQTHVHWVNDAIQSSHPLLTLSLPALNLSQHQGLPMSWLFVPGGQITGDSASASVLSMNIQGWFPLRWTGLISLLSKGHPKFSPTLQFKRISYLTLSLLQLYGALWTAANQASLSFTISQNLLKLMSIESGSLWSECWYVCSQKSLRLSSILFIPFSSFCS